MTNLSTSFDSEALWLSLRLATSTTFLLFLGGVPLAYGLSQKRWKFQFLVDTLISLPLVLPPTVLGFYLLLLLGAQTVLQPFSFGGLLLGSVIYSLPFAFQPTYQAFLNVPPRAIEAAHSLGASRWRTFYRIIFPHAFPGILSGMILAFAHTLGEFGIVLMVGGNIPGVTRTLSIAIYDDVQSLNYARANSTSALLLLISFGALLWVNLLKQRTR